MTAVGYEYSRNGSTDHQIPNEHVKLQNDIKETQSQLVKKKKKEEVGHSSSRNSNAQMRPYGERVWDMTPDEDLWRSSEFKTRTRTKLIK